MLLRSFQINRHSQLLSHCSKRFAHSATAAPAPVLVTPVSAPKEIPVMDLPIQQQQSNIATSHYEFHVPPAFGVEHEPIPLGHEPGTMWHINALQDFFGAIHDSLGLEWWATISLGTILFRLLALPLNIGLIRNSTRLALIREDIEQNAQVLKKKLPSLEEMMKEDHISTVSTMEEQQQEVLKREELLRNLMTEKYEAARRIDELLKTNKCHPMLNIISPVLMAPMFLSIFVSIERICIHDPGAKTEGLLWFTDLSVLDPTWTLPVMSALTWLITIELGADNPRTVAMQQFKSVLRFLAAVMVPITSPLPAGVFVYWITSNLFSIVQILTLQRFSKLRRFLGIPSRDATSKALNKKPIAL